MKITTLSILIVLTVIVVIFGVFGTTSKEHFFYEHVVSDYYEKLRDNHIQSLTIDPVRGENGHFEQCKVTVTTLVDGENVTLHDHFLIDQTDYLSYCKPGYTKMYFQSAFLSWPDRYRINLDSTVVKKQYLEVDLPVFRKVVRSTDLLLPKVLDFSDKMIADYQSLLAKKET